MVLIINVPTLYAVEFEDDIVKVWSYYMLKTKVSMHGLPQCHALELQNDSHNTIKA